MQYVGGRRLGATVHARVCVCVDTHDCNFDKPCQTRFCKRKDSQVSKCCDICSVTHLLSAHPMSSYDSLLLDSREPTAKSPQSSSSPDLPQVRPSVSLVLNKHVYSGTCNTTLALAPQKKKL